MAYSRVLGGRVHHFAGLKSLLAKASPARAGDTLAGVAATSEAERMAARFLLADLPLKRFLEEPVVPYEDDEVTRLIFDTHTREAFAEISHLTVGDFRNWLLHQDTDTATLARAADGITPEMAAAASKLMRNQDLIVAARKCRTITRFRTTIGLPGRLSVRLQPNHPTDDPKGIAAAILDGLIYGCGDAVIGINPARDNLPSVMRLLRMVDELRTEYEIPTQSCVLTHVTNTIAAIGQGAPVDLVFQSIAGTQAANTSFGINLAMLREAQQSALELHRAPPQQATLAGDPGGAPPQQAMLAGDPGGAEGNLMYFETGQGSALSANAHHGVDQQTCEARAYGVARAFSPLLVNTVVGFIGPEYLFDGKEIIRAGLEDHFCGKLLGLPMGCDICYTNHAEADQDDMDILLTLLGVAGVNFIIGVPGADDIMLNYQSTSFHDALYLRRVLGLRCAPEFEEWLSRVGITDRKGELGHGGRGLNLNAARFLGSA